MINFYLNSDSLEVGSELTGSCIWTPSTQKKEKSLKLIIGWRTEGRGNVDKEALYETELKPSERSYFKCNIPMAGPISYDGQLLRIIWEIAVTRRNWLGLQDTLQTQVFRVIPRS